MYCVSAQDYAFCFCSNLTSVTIKPKISAEINQSTFSSLANITLYVPASCKAANKATDYRKELKKINHDFGSQSQQKQTGTITRKLF